MKKYGMNVKFGGLNRGDILSDLAGHAQPWPWHGAPGLAGVGRVTIWPFWTPGGPWWWVGSFEIVQRVWCVECVNRLIGSLDQNPRSVHISRAAFSFPDQSYRPLLHCVHEGNVAFDGSPCFQRGGIVGGGQSDCVSDALISSLDVAHRMFDRLYFCL